MEESGCKRKGLAYSSTNTKVHLHRDAGDGHFLGNERADAWAKKTVWLASSPLVHSQQHRTGLDSHIKDLRSMMKVLAFWPNESADKATRPETKVPKSPLSQQHDSSVALGRKICVCRKCCRGARTSRHLATKPCRALGLSKIQNYIRMEGMGHRVMEVGPTS